MPNPPRASAVKATERGRVLPWQCRAGLPSGRRAADDERVSIAWSELVREGTLDYITKYVAVRLVRNPSKVGFPIPIPVTERTYVSYP